VKFKTAAGMMITGRTRWKMCTYARVRCEILSEGARLIEGRLRSNGLKFTRLIDPDPYLLASSGDGIYDLGKFLMVIELTDGLGRLFYLTASDVPVSLKELPRPEFVLAFRVKKKEGFLALLDVIGRKGIGGIRHKHRSLLNFLISFAGSLLISSIVNIVNIKGYLGPAILMLPLALAIFIVLDYPFSLLYLKGVEVIQNPEPSAKVFIIKVKRTEKKGS